MSEFLDHAVEAHRQWKQTVAAAIEKGEPIDRARAGADDQCELGKWIYGAGRTFEDIPVFRDLVVKHRNFHSCVCGVADLIAAGRLSEAREEVERGTYHRASIAIIDCLHRLKVMQVAP